MGVVGALLSKMLGVLFIKVLGLPSTELPGALMAAGGDTLLVDVLGALLVLGTFLAEVLGCKAWLRGELVGFNFCKTKENLYDIYVCM